MGFNAITEYADASITLPVPGKDGQTREYRIEGPNAITGIWVQDIFRVGIKAVTDEDADITAEDVARLKLDDSEEQDLMKRLLGPSLDHMVADGVSWPWIQLVNQTALIWVAAGRERAELFWNSGGVPKAQRREPADRKASEKSGRQGSPAGTTSTKAKRKPKASAGSTFSTTGT